LVAAFSIYRSTTFVDFQLPACMIARASRARDQHILSRTNAHGMAGQGNCGIRGNA